MTDPTAPPVPPRRTRPGSGGRKSAAEAASPPLDRFFELTETLLCVIGLNGRFRYVSPGWEATLGWPTGELLARPYLDFVHPEDRAATRAFALRAMTQGPAAPFENRCKTRDGGYRWLRWSARPVLADSLIYASAMDVTDHHTVVEELARNERALARQAEELARARDAALAATRAKSGFLATMSHELRTPLNSIIGFSEVLLNADNLTEKQHRWAGNIMTSGQQLLALINDILELAKLEAGKMRLSPKPVDPRTLCEQAAALYRVQAEKKAVELRVEAPERTPLVYQDAGKLNQILNNLISNAIKFTPEGGRVTVRAEVAGERFVLTVTDTGVGIAPEEQELVFEKFRQASNPLTREQGGSGLGLSIVREMAKLLGGDVALRSDLGRGSTFTVRVAARLPDDPVAALELPEPTASAV